MNDLSAGWYLPVKKADMSIELNVYNLLNESYHSVLYRPMPGRNYHLVIKVQI